MAADVLDKLKELIKESYNKKGGGRTATWVRGELIAAKANGEIQGEIPSERTVYRYCAQAPRYEHHRDADGKRGAVEYEPIHDAPSVKGSPHGQRDWQIAHVDSTPLDLALAHANQDKEIRKDTLCRMTDPYGGKLLASVTTSGPVNSMRIRDLLWDCWVRNGRLPRIIVCDWGSEHNNAWLQKACAFLTVTLIFREKSAPRKGAPVETTFSTTNRQVIHNLTGTTKLLRKARMVSSLNIQGATLWTSEDLKELLEDDLTLRNELPRQRKPSPNAIAIATEKKFGPAPILSLSTEQVRIALLPFVDGPKRKVSERGEVRCMGKTYYSDQLVEFAGQHIDLRRDPNKPDLVYAIPPRGRRTIECPRRDLSGPTADLLEEAKIIDQQTLGMSPFKNVTPAQYARAQITDAVNTAEKSMRADKTATRRRKSANPNAPSPKTDKSNLLTFTLTPTA